ncbi:hypothetical protein [Streptomyces smyrnaeus]|uniref:hypothetical protein n=1 Tax=Streptomyces smyrnaeus TaxID=1387713 RepID=UPI0036982ED0
MADMIHIKPAPAQRVAFARWAVAQRPKIRTVSPNAFAVPPDLFVQAPEDVLLGSIVDGHRYVSPDEEEAVGRPAPAGPELLGVATPESFTATPWLEEMEAVPGEPLPEVPDSAYAPDAVPLTPPDDTESDRSDSSGDTGDAPYVCESCGRDFTSERGRDMHRRRVHREA